MSRKESKLAGGPSSVYLRVKILKLIANNFFLSHRHYLGQTEPAAVKGAIADLQERVANLEGKLAGLGG